MDSLLTEGAVKDKGGYSEVSKGGTTYELSTAEIQRADYSADSTTVDRAGGSEVQDPGAEVYYAAGARKEKRTALQAKIVTIKTDVERVTSPTPNKAARVLAPLGKKAQKTLQVLCGQPCVYKNPLLH